MGREKEAQLEREEQIRLHVKKCEICGQPLVAIGERGVCASCAKAMNDE
jgi:hypothetical protein